MCRSRTRHSLAKRTSPIDSGQLIDLENTPTCLGLTQIQVLDRGVCALLAAGEGVCGVTTSHSLVKWITPVDSEGFQTLVRTLTLLVRLFIE